MSNIIVSDSFYNDQVFLWQATVVTYYGNFIIVTNISQSLILFFSCPFWFNPTKVNNHFGESPIYGIIVTKRVMEGNGHMVPHKGNMTMMEKSSSFSSAW